MKFPKPTSNYRFGIKKMKNWLSIIIILVFTTNYILPQNSTLKKNPPELPIKEYYVAGTSDYFVIMYTGDGGWKSLALGLADYFQDKKVPFVGLDVKKYFWTKRSQNEISTSLEGIINYYCSEWHKNKVVLIGYSFGAEVLPFAAGEISNDLKLKIKKVILIAPGQKAAFEVTIGSMLDFSGDGLPVASELTKIPSNDYFILCDDSEDALCNVLNRQYDYSVLKGGHHFDGDFGDLYQSIWQKIETVDKNKSPGAQE
jgi:type IV secretory pathway VirJ component